RYTPLNPDLRKPSLFLLRLLTSQLYRRNHRVPPRRQTPSRNFCDNILKCEEDGTDIPWLEVKPRVGRAIFWYNLDTRGEKERRSLHAGAEVKRGTKVGL